MGQEMSAPNGIQSPADITIPTSLRPVHPFLEDAQRNLCNARNIVDNTALVQSRKKVAVACINHAFKLVNILNLEWDSEGRQCLDTFRVIRDTLSEELGLLVDQSCVLQEYVARQPFPSHEIIIAEADEALALGELQQTEGFKFDAMLNYHTACVYYRVMECMIPALTSLVHQRLQYAAWRARQCSSLSHNFVVEHFDGESCSEIYEVHGSNKLGKGSYGSVYLATHRLTGDERAVKVMNVDRVTSYYLRKLHTEISILKCVDHPNIIKLQDVFFGKRSVYLVTDLCRGGELYELLNSGKNQGFVFREDRASRLMRDMLSAVHYLHSKGIVHRDLKLENFLFEAKNSSSPLVLIDFGLSKHFDKEDRLTHRVGSCYYTAPEVLAGCYDYRCDTWSLGVLCYMLLSGSPPFYGKTVEDVYKATSTQEPGFPDKKFRHLSPVCMDFMRKLLVKDPNLRMSTGQALRHPFITGQVSPLPYLSPTNALGTPPSAPSPPSPWGIGSIGMGLGLSQKETRGGSRDTTRQASPLTICQGGPVASQHSGTHPVLTLESAVKIIDSMVIYLAADPLTRLTMEMVAHTLCADHTQQLRIDFQAMDRNHQGVITFKEMSDSLEIAQHHAAYNSIDLSAAFQDMCVEHSRGGPSGHLNLNTNGGNALHRGGVYGGRQEDCERTLTYHEFITAAMMSRVTLEEERVTLAFNCLDIEKRGVLSSNGVRLALGDDLSQSNIDSMLSIASERAAARGESLCSASSTFTAGNGEGEGMPISPVTLQGFLSGWKFGTQAPSAQHMQQQQQQQQHNLYGHLQHHHSSSIGNSCSSAYASKFLSPTISTSQAPSRRTSQNKTEDMACSETDSVPVSRRGSDTQLLPDVQSAALVSTDSGSQRYYSQAKRQEVSGDIPMDVEEPDT